MHMLTFSSSSSLHPHPLPVTWQQCTCRLAICVNKPLIHPFTKYLCLVSKGFDTVVSSRQRHNLSPNLRKWGKRAVPEEAGAEDGKSSESCESFLPRLLSAQPLGVIACWIHAHSTLVRQSRPSFKNQHAKHGYQLSFSYCLSMSHWINNAEPFSTLCSPAAGVQALHLFLHTLAVLSRAG